MIRFDHVHKEYPRVGLALNDVSFELRKGEFCFLTGHSGAGKSTILRLIHMAEWPTSGEVRVSGFSSETIRRREIAILRRKVSFIFQDFRLLPDRTAAENVAFALEVTGAHRSVIHSKVGRLLGQVGLSTKAGAYPNELSGGERQRVLLARLLAVQAPVLLMDEPLAHLDPPHQADWMAEVRRLAAGGALVVSVLHELGMALQADELLIVRNGRVVHHGACASPATHRALQAAFDDRVEVRQVDHQWVALPRIPQEASVHAD